MWRHHPGNRVSDVAAGRGQRAEVGGDDGHRGGDALDDGDADRSRSLDRTGIHRRTRHRITTAHRYHLGRAAARVSRDAHPGPSPQSRRDNGAQHRDEHAGYH